MYKLLVTRCTQPGASRGVNDAAAAGDETLRVGKRLAAAVPVCEAVRERIPQLLAKIVFERLLFAFPRRRRPAADDRRRNQSGGRKRPHHHWKRICHQLRRPRCPPGGGHHRHSFACHTKTLASRQVIGVERGAFGSYDGLEQPGLGRDDLCTFAPRIVEANAQ